MASGQSQRPPTAPRHNNSQPYVYAFPQVSLPAATAAENGGVSCKPDGSSKSVPAMGSASAQHWKLRHIDFAPISVRGKKDDEFERFPALVERANQWSAENTQALVFSCETVTWSGIDRNIFTDSGLLQKSMNSEKKSRFMRGLRVWYVVLDETFYDKNSCLGPFKLGFVNYAFETKNDNIHNLLTRINGDILKKTISGKILKLETIPMMNDIGDPDVCFWSEQPEKSRQFVYFMRILYMLKKDGQENTMYGEIGIRDVVPQFDQRTPLNQGYETFSDLWRSAAQWIFKSPSLQFINAQGIFIKAKKEANAGKDTAQSISKCLERPAYSEHGSAYGSISHQKTEYNQILRIVYHQPPVHNPMPTATEANQGGAGSRLSYKSFSPAALRRPALPGLALSGGQAVEAEPIESTYEDLRQLEDKINAWLSYTGAKVHGVETIPTRLVTGGQEMLGPEATFAYNDREKNQSREYWRVNIRLHLDGDFKEPPVPWSSLDDVTQRCDTGSVYSLS